VLRLRADRKPHLALHDHCLHRERVRVGVHDLVGLPAALEHLVGAGGAMFGPAIAQRVIDFFTRPRSAAPLAFPQLTDREHEILDLLAGGHANATIAARLHISDKTVRNHVSNIFTKLAVADRAQAIIRAREAGLGGSSDRQHTGEPG
jgi:DNA-binding NarL/FixJ family response regulator